MPESEPPNVSVYFREILNPNQEAVARAWQDAVLRGVGFYRLHTSPNGQTVTTHIPVAGFYSADRKEPSHE